MNCTLLMKSNKEGTWRQMKSKSIAFVEAHGIVVRDSNTHSLQADLFTDKIHEMKNIFLIKVTHDMTNATALSFDSMQDAQEFSHAIDTSPIMLIKKEISTNTNFSDDIIPNLADTSVQSYVLRLLFNNDFINLVDDMRELLKSMNSRLEGMTPATTDNNTHNNFTETASHTDPKMETDYYVDNNIDADEISAASVAIMEQVDQQLDDECHGDNGYMSYQSTGFKIETGGTGDTGDTGGTINTTGTGGTGGTAGTADIGHDNLNLTPDSMDDSLDLKDDCSRLHEE